MHCCCTSTCCSLRLSSSSQPENRRQDVVAVWILELELAGALLLGVLPWVTCPTLAQWSAPVIRYVDISLARLISRTRHSSLLLVHVFELHLQREVAPPAASGAGRGGPSLRASAASGARATRASSSAPMAGGAAAPSRGTTLADHGLLPIDRDDLVKPTMVASYINDIY